ncbi:MAG: type IV secretion system DNA-binding domain-containing protein [Azospirillaceae bacterium]
MKHIGDTISTLGNAYTRHGGLPFGLRPQDRLLHLYVIGQTGTGKSTLLGNLALQDAAAGTGFCLIDPHGDLADAVTARLSDDVIVWNVADPDCPYGYNPLSRVPARYRALVAAAVIDALKKQWSDAWGARMEHLLRYALLALLEKPRADLRDVMRLFIDSEFRKEATAHIEDPQVRGFWTVEYRALKYASAVDGVAPIANKTGALLAHPVVRRALCEPATPLRLRQIMDSGGQLIINLAKGRLGADTANVIGGLMLSMITSAAFSRQETPSVERQPFMLHVDEFHAFTTATIAEMLPESRKYGLGLALAHQHVAQVEPGVMEAVWGNVGSRMVFRVGASDAPTLARQLQHVSEIDLMNLPNYRAVARLMIDGTTSRAFSVDARPWPQESRPRKPEAA